MTPPSEHAILVQQVALENGYFAARLSAPKSASRARPGQRLVVDTHRGAAPVSLALMRADSEAGWIEVLYPTDAPERVAFSQRPRASAFEVRLDDDATRWTLPTVLSHVAVVADQEHMASAVFLADNLRKQGLGGRCLVLLELSSEPPFRPRPSHILVGGMPAGVIAAMPLLEDWNVPSRLASRTVRPGCFEGAAGDLALCWLRTLNHIPGDLILATAGIDKPYIEQLSQHIERVYPIADR